MRVLTRRETSASGRQLALCVPLARLALALRSANIEDQLTSPSMQKDAPPAKLAWPGTAAWLRLLTLATLGLLGIQYFLGMEVNIYLAPPYSSSNLIFSLHYSLGILVLGFSLAILAVSVLTRDLPTVTASVVGFMSIAVAGEAGRQFAFSSQNNYLSLAMSLGFLVAFGAYIAEAFLLNGIVAREGSSAAA